MRVTTAFNRMLGLPGTRVQGVESTGTGFVVDVRPSARMVSCPCGWRTRSVYDRRERKWRHLAAGTAKLWLRAVVRRVYCRRCQRVRTEQVPWARCGSRLTRDLEDVITWAAQRMDKTTVATLMRVAWKTVDDVVVRVVDEHINDKRLDSLYRIGVDEISYRKGHKFLTCVVDHDTGATVWVGEGRGAETLEKFYDQLDPERCAQLQAVSLDMGPSFIKATRVKAPDARACIDPFHVIKLANEAIETTRRWCWNNERGGRGQADPRTREHSPARGRPQWVKQTRWALLKAPENLKDKQRQILDQLRAERHILWQAYDLKEELRRLYRLPADEDPAIHLDLWIERATTSDIPAMVKLARTITRHRQGILAAVELGMTNSRLEGTNSKTRLINHRGYGHHTAAALIAMIYLCSGGLHLQLPTRT